MMEHKEYWQTKLTPYDAELALMVESLTEMPCELKNGGDHYFFEADYSKHNDAQWILAVWDAIEGRTGKRLIDIKDDPDRTCLFVHVKFSEQEYPHFYGSAKYSKPKPGIGNVYCRQLEEIIALQVKPGAFDQLVEFVGNGEMEIPEKGYVLFHFRNAYGSVYEHANENDYIVFVKNGLFIVVDQATFEKEYEPKWEG